MPARGPAHEGHAVRARAGPRQGAPGPLEPPQGEGGRGEAVQPDHRRACAFPDRLRERLVDRHVEPALHAGVDDEPKSAGGPRRGSLRPAPERSSRVLLPLQLVDVLPRGVRGDCSFGRRDHELAERACPHVAHRVQAGHCRFHALVGLHVAHVVQLHAQRCGEAALGIRADEDEDRGDLLFAFLARDTC